MCSSAVMQKQELEKCFANVCKHHDVEVVKKNGSPAETEAVAQLHPSAYIHEMYQIIKSYP